VLLAKTGVAANTARAATDDNKTFFHCFISFYSFKNIRYFVTMTSILGYVSPVKSFLSFFLKILRFFPI